MKKLSLLVIASLLAACIIEEPSPLGRPCDRRAVCGPGAICRDKVCVSDNETDAALPDAELDAALPDIEAPDGPVDTLDQGSDSVGDGDSKVDDASPDQADLAVDQSPDSDGS